MVGSEPGHLLTAVAGAEGMPVEFAVAAKSLGERQAASGNLFRSASQAWFS